jgi:hypothetical protein
MGSFSGSLGGCFECKVAGVLPVSQTVVHLCNVD